MTEQLIGKLGYIGISLILILGGLGLPIPEEAPILVAAVLSRTGKMQWPLALGSCLAGVLLGDLVVYSLGFFYGERVLSLRLTRRLLTRQREAQIKGYFHRHGFKILVSGRFVPGFRTAAYLTAGILKLPPVRLLLTDLLAASLSTLFFFVLGYAFAYQIQQGIREVQQWVLVLLAVGIVIWLLVRYYGASAARGCPSARRCWIATRMPCRSTICPACRVPPVFSRRPRQSRLSLCRPTTTSSRQARATKPPRRRVPYGGPGRSL